MSFSHNDLSDEFHMWLGYCIANWAKVEDLLFQVFWHALQSPLPPASIVYYRTPTLAARLGLTDELIKRVLPPPEREKSKGGHDHPSVKEWISICNDVRDLLAIRSRLAHHRVSVRDELFSIGEDDGGFSELLGTRWAEVHMSDAEILRSGKRNEGVLKLGDLKVHRADTELIRLRLFNFLKDTLQTHAQEHPAQRLRTDLR
jgi:hypothetical protein